MWPSVNLFCQDHAGMGKEKNFEASTCLKAHYIYTPAYQKVFYSNHQQRGLRATASLYINARIHYIFFGKNEFCLQMKTSVAKLHFIDIC